jgi:tRNA (guanine37-N1)-methyltransferase
MRFDVITLFPELFPPFLTSGVTRRAFESGLVKVRIWNLRDFAGATTAVSTTVLLAGGLAW